MKCKECKDPQCNFNKCELGHECTSVCGKEKECPCQSEHYCSRSIDKEEMSEEKEFIFQEVDCKDCLDTGLVFIPERDENGAIVGSIEKKCHCMYSEEGYDNDR